MSEKWPKKKKGKKAHAVMFWSKGRNYKKENIAEQVPGSHALNLEDEIHMTNFPEALAP